jgi:hypothetical protein
MTSSTAGIPQDINAYYISVDISACKEETAVTLAKEPQEENRRSHKEARRENQHARGRRMAIPGALKGQ